jgi:hypothetical protein
MKDEDLIRLKALLMEYRTATESIIKSVEEDEAEQFEKQINIRQDIINEMSCLTYTKEAFTHICKELGILELQLRLDTLVNEKKVELKSKISEINEKKNANKSYINNSNTFNRNFFNTQV